MKFNATTKTMEQITGEAYATMMSHYETAKQRLGQMVHEAIKSNGNKLEREDAPELFDLIDLYQLDDAYILNDMHYKACLHGNKDRMGTRYIQRSYTIELR